MTGIGSRLRRWREITSDPTLITTTVQAESLRALLSDAERMHAALLEYGRAPDEYEHDPDPSIKLGSDLRDGRMALETLALELAEEK